MVTYLKRQRGKICLKLCITQRQDLVRWRATREAPQDELSEDWTDPPKYHLNLMWFSLYLVCARGGEPGESAANIKVHEQF